MAPLYNNVYTLRSFGENIPAQQVCFYELNEDGTHEDGTTLEEMLEVCMLRLTDLNLRFPCRENSVAITKMEEALLWLNRRTQNRIKRAVEGTHQI